MKNKAIFLDRDGVINENIYEVDGKIMSPAKLDQVVLLPLVKEGILNLKKIGFKIIVISNQPGIDLGYLNKDNLEKINSLLETELGIDKVYFCPHHPKKTKECSCRKPNVGLVLKAKEDFNLDLESCYFVGDSLSDIETGKNVNAKKTVLIGEDRLDVRNIMNKKGIFPDVILSNLLEVYKYVKEIETNHN